MGAGGLPLHGAVDEALAVVGNEVLLRLTLLELSQRPLGRLDVVVMPGVGLHTDVTVRGVASLKAFKRRDLATWYPPTIKSAR